MLRHPTTPDTPPTLELRDTATGKEYSLDWRTAPQGATSGTHTLAKAPDSESRIMNATVNSNGTRVAIANEDGIIRLWDVALGKELASWQLGKAAPDFLLLSPDGGRILAITWRDFVSEKEFWNGVGEGEGTSGEYSPGGRITRYW